MSPEPAQPVARDGDGGAAAPAGHEGASAAPNSVGDGVGGGKLAPQGAQLQDESSLVDGERPLGESNPESDQLTGFPVNADCRGSDRAKPLAWRCVGCQP